MKTKPTVTLTEKLTGRFGTITALIDSIGENMKELFTVKKGALMYHIEFGSNVLNCVDKEIQDQYRQPDGKYKIKVYLLASDKLAIKLVDHKNFGKERLIKIALLKDKIKVTDVVKSYQIAQKVLAGEWDRFL